MRTQDAIDKAFVMLGALREEGIDPFVVNHLWSTLRSYQSFRNTVQPLLRELKELRGGVQPPLETLSGASKPGG